MAGVLLTEAEASESLRVCERTLRDMRRTGELPFVLIRRRVFYTMADIDAYIEGQRQWASIAATTRRSGGTASPSTVVGFEEARDRLRKASPKPSKLPSAPRPRIRPRSVTGGASTC